MNHSHLLSHKSSNPQINFQTNFRSKQTFKTKPTQKYIHSNNQHLLPLVKNKLKKKIKSKIDHIQNYQQKHTQQTRLTKAQSNIHLKSLSINHNETKQIKINQKTVPIELHSESSSFVKDIISRSKSKKHLYELKQLKINKHQDQSSLKSQKCISNSLNHNIRSLKQINIFRIRSKLNLRDTQDIQQRSQKKIVQNKQIHFQSLRPNSINSLNNKYLSLKRNENQNITNQKLKSQSIEHIDISQIREANSQKGSQSSIQIPQIDCSVIKNNKQLFNESSFLSESEKIMFEKIGRQKNIANYDNHGSKLMGIAPTQLKKLLQQKCRKKMIEVQKLRKKFPQDFFKV